MTTKQKLYQIIEGLQENEAENLLSYLQNHSSTGPSHRAAFEQAIDELVSQISDEEAKKAPSDLAENLDHYLYGSSKK